MKLPFFSKIFLLIILSISSIIGQQWKWQNPLPQGNMLDNIEFVDSLNGWIRAGNNLMRTTDGGENWIVEYVGHEFGPQGIHFIDPLNGWGVGSGNPAFIIKSSDGGKTWNELPIPEEIQNIYMNLHDVFFTDDSTGYIVTDMGTIYNTCDSGESWERQIFFKPGRDIRSIYFTDKEKGFAVGDMPLLRTSNGGKEWLVDSTMLGDSSFGLEAQKILFADSLHGWILTKYSLYRTNNGGINWREHEIDTNPLEIKLDLGEYVANDIMFLNSKKGWVSTSWGLYHSNDSGKTWQAIIDTMSFTSVYFLNGEFGFASASGGINYRINNEYFKTTDGGVSWEPLTKKYTDAVLYGVDFVDENNGWAVGTHGVIINTEDGGKTWHQQVSGVETTDNFKSWLRDVQFVDLYNGWAVGDNGIILRTTDGGINWQFQSSGTEYRLEDCTFINNREGWIVGDLIILHTTNSGQTWEVLNEEIGSLYGIHFIDSLKGWIVTGGGAIYNKSHIYRTIDGGKNWELQLDEPEFDFRKVVFHDSLKGWVTGGNGILRTIDGGNNWEETKNVTNTFVANISFVDSLYGWICGIQGKIFHTYDGGETWISQKSRVGSGFTLYDINFVNKKNGWAVGLFGTIIHTTSGSITSVKEIPFEKPLDDNFELYPNYPNPFNPATTISYKLSDASVVTLEIFDILGENITTLLNKKEHLPGSYAVQWKANNLSTGIYFYRLTVNEQVKVNKMLLLK